MPRFSPFRGVRYNAEGGWVDDVVAPPYDVISPDDRAVLAQRSEFNAVHLELPVDDNGRSRYDIAADLWRAWQSDRVLVADDEPSFYVYRMGFHDEDGKPRQTSGVLGALELTPPGAGILPHERTTPKDKADRLNILQKVRANLSPIWGLTPAVGLAGLCDIEAPPDVRATDDDGVHHRVWRVTAPAILEAIGAAVASEPVILADGHHRYEVALGYRSEVGGGNGSDAILTYVVPLAEDQVAVRAIHRLVTGVAPDVDLLAALAPYFDTFDSDRVDETITARMADAGALALTTPTGTWLLRPLDATTAAAEHDLDSSRLDVALASLPGAEVRFQHGWDLAARAVEKGEAQFAVLLRPATVDQIAAIGRGGSLMPPKTTFFHPKPRTGLVFRSLDLA